MTILLAAAAAAAVAQGYPTTFDPETIRTWLQRTTELAPDQVVAVTPSAAVAMVGRAPAAGGRTEVRLWAVALTPEAASRSGVLAWEMRLEVDCRTGQARTGATTGFASRTARTNGIPLAPGEAAWRKPQAGTALDSAWRAVCDRNFRPPLAPGQARITPGVPLRPSLPPPQAPAPPATPPTAARAPPRPTPAATPPAPPRARGSASVQVVSSAAEADARQKLASLRRRFGGALEGIEARVEPARVQGRAVYRGVFTGFASRREALAFCQTLKKAGEDCLAR